MHSDIFETFIHITSLSLLMLWRKIQMIMYSVKTNKICGLMAKIANSTVFIYFHWKNILLTRALHGHDLIWKLFVILQRVRKF